MFHQLLMTARIIRSTSRGHTYCSSTSRAKIWLNSFADCEAAMSLLFQANHERQPKQRPQARISIKNPEPSNYRSGWYETRRSCPRAGQLLAGFPSPRFLGRTEARINPGQVNLSAGESALYGASDLQFRARLQNPSRRRNATAFNLTHLPSCHAAGWSGLPVPVRRQAQPASPACGRGWRAGNRCACWQSRQQR